jgi:hypothetical protein
MQANVRRRLRLQAGIHMSVASVREQITWRVAGKTIQVGLERQGTGPIKKFSRSRSHHPPGGDASFHLLKDDGVALS